MELDPKPKEVIVTLFLGKARVASFAAIIPRYYPTGWYSKALFCPYCGDVWARYVVAGHPFYCDWNACPQHGRIELDSGTLVHSIAVLDYYPYLPAEVWNWELRRWAERPELWEAEVYGVDYVG